MPLLSRPDGIEIAWETEGAGPLVLMGRVSYTGPERINGLVADLARDHTVLNFDARGTGASTRAGPYDLETDAEDLAAVLEHTGPALAGVGSGDGGRVLVKVAARRPELIGCVALSGAQVFAPHGAGHDPASLSSSRSVLRALLQLLETDYRAGLNTMIKTATPEVSEEALRENIDHVERHCDQAPMVARMRAWMKDDSRAEAARLGSRLWILHHGTNPWFVGGMAELRADLLDARLVEVPDGVVDAPTENADVIRTQILAAAPQTER